MTSTRIPGGPATSGPLAPPVGRKAAAKLDRPAFQQQKPMKALVWHKPEHVAVENVPRPTLGSAGDAIVRITAAAICGSDLHHYHGAMPGMMDGDIMGHEFIGIVEEVGPAVEKVKVGDRVAVSCVIACGECGFCLEKNTSFCDTTNQNPLQALEWGQSLAAVYGYTHQTGGHPGGHAGWTRVPYADFNTLKLPDDMPDEQAVALGDSWCTGWMAAEYAEAAPGMTMAVWGLGPIGLLTMEAARAKGVTRFIAIDRVPERLEVARRRFGAATINYDEVSEIVPRVLELTSRRGADACVDATGFRYAKTVQHKVQKALRLEMDSIDALKEAIKSVRKGGRVVPIADFVGDANQFPIGAVMEKGVTMRSSQVHPHKYWNEVMQAILEGRYDPTFTLTHKVPLDQAPEMYRKWDKKEDGVIKVMLRP
jgi:threonine dehydrogenase-like Zn-dependent dehydrogenase